MSLRYLFGPAGADFTAMYLQGPRARGECLAFNLQDGADLSIGPADCWDNICGRLPSGWTPDFIALWLPYAQVPACLWEAPVPLVGLAADWQLLWHAYRAQLRRCELILT